jgi:hypothetical protein
VREGKSIAMVARMALREKLDEMGKALDFFDTGGTLGSRCSAAHSLDSAARSTWRVCSSSRISIPIG